MLLIGYMNNNPIWIRPWNNPRGLGDVKVKIDMLVLEPNFPLILGVRRSILFQIYFDLLQTQLSSN